VNSGTTRAVPHGLTAFGVFLLWGAAMASLAGTTLVWRGTILDRIWELNRRAYHQLAPLGNKAGISLLVLAVFLGAAGIGWLMRRRWAWRLAAVILMIHILGDLLNLFIGRVVEGVIGVAAAGALLWYVSKADVRAYFLT
jgi:hypothetical protein